MASFTLSLPQVPDSTRVDAYPASAWSGVFPEGVPRGTFTATTTASGASATFSGLANVPYYAVITTVADSYSTGTVTLTEDDKTVTGSGTSWEANIEPGDVLRYGTERVYVVESVTSDTALELTDAYEGTTAAGLSYSIYRGDHDYRYFVVSSDSPDVENVAIQPAGSIIDGRKEVTSAGTRVQLTSTPTPIKQVAVTAETNNTNTVVVGASTVVAAVGTRKGIPLVPSGSITLQVDDLADVWIDSVVDTEGVTYIALVA